MDFALAYGAPALDPPTPASLFISSTILLFILRYRIRLHMFFLRSQSCPSLPLT